MPAPGWLMLGVVAHLCNQVARGCGWYSVVCAATKERPRRRDVVAAWVAGAGAGGVVSARGGDAVRILVLGRRLEGERTVLAGTLVAECVGETALGVLTLVLALAFGIDAMPDRNVVLLALAGLLVLLALALLARKRPFVARMRRGCAALKHPGAYARQVVPWQLVSRIARLVALGCFLAAFHLPATLAAVLLVTFAQCSGRVLPFAPASLGAGAAILAATFGPMTGTDVSVQRLTEFFVGTSVVLTVVGTALALAICGTQASANWRLKLGRRMRPAAAPNK